jgi:hypothetical protein
MEDRRSQDPVGSERRGRMFGLIGWAVVMGIVLAWQGFGLVRLGDEFPTLTDVLRKVTAHGPGRLILFGSWLWLGWHLFVLQWREWLRW